MKVLITEMGAPWPEGAGVGQVVDIGERSEIPAWALGKCEIAAEEPVIEKAKPEPDGDDIDALKAEAEALGIKVHHLWKAPRLLEEIAKAKEAKQ